MVYEIFLALAAFLFGTCVGSFMDVVRTRVSWRKSLSGRSVCIGCGKTLCWYELIPIVSYLCLWGKCGSCSARVSGWHTLSEVLMGALFALAVVVPDSLYLTVAAILAAVFLVPIVIADAESMEVPEHLSVPFAYAALGFALGSVIHTTDITPLLGGLILASPFYLFWFVSSGRAMGLGDAKVALPVGFLIPTIIGAVSVFIFSFWIGAFGIALYAAYMLLTTGSFRLKRRMRIPLVPCIAAAYFLIIFTGISFMDIPEALQHLISGFA